MGLIVGLVEPCLPSIIPLVCYLQDADKCCTSLLTHGVQMEVRGTFSGSQMSFGLTGLVNGGRATRALCSV